MDEQHLKNILKNRDIPEADENAKKRALNLAQAAFEREQKKNEKKRQGFPFFFRLMGHSNKNPRRKHMNRKMIYGGMATAMAVILITGVTVEQFSSTRSGALLNDAAVEQSLVKTTNHLAPATSEPQPLAKSPAKSQAMVAERKRVLSETTSRSMADMAGKVAPPMAMEQSLVGRVAPAPMTGGAANMAFAPADDYQAGYYQDVGRDKFEDFEENAVKLVQENPVSTFAVDVDTASYSFMRRQLNHGVLPQKDAVRVEELINYFDYNYPVPETKEAPFKPTIAVTPSPWRAGNKLVHIGIKGYELPAKAQPNSNLVFLLDTSGSMNSPDKLPLVINSLKLLLDRLGPDDTVAIVTYAGSAGTVLEPTPASEKAKILSALENLRAGGSTAGAEGIRQAYNLAELNFGKDAVNRVILATDGDFNVGITNREELKDFVERKRDSGIFLSVIGFGQGNLNDQMMQTLAQNGNGVAAYIDNLNEARKILVEEASSTLFPIAKDVKIQVEFNPKNVSEYRLIGYETRALKREDFNNDAVDAGDIGAGHTVTAIYEITPADSDTGLIGASRYQTGEENAKPASDDKAEGSSFAPHSLSDEYAFVKIRYKLPDEDSSSLIAAPVTAVNERLLDNVCARSATPETCDLPAPMASDDTAFATAVAAFGQLLKGGTYTGTYSYDDVIALAQQGKGADPFGYRSEFIQLVRLAKSAAALPRP